MGDGWMIRGTDAEKEARIPALMGMPALPAPGSLAPRSLCPRCSMPLLWTAATSRIPPLRSTLAPLRQPTRVHIVLYWLPTTPGCWGVLSASLQCTWLIYLFSTLCSLPLVPWLRALLAPMLCCSSPCKDITQVRVAMGEVSCNSSAPSPPLMIIQPHTSL